MLNNIIQKHAWCSESEDLWYSAECGQLCCSCSYTIRFQNVARIQYRNIVWVSFLNLFSVSHNEIYCWQYDASKIGWWLFGHPVYTRKKMGPIENRPRLILINSLFPYEILGRVGTSVVYTTFQNKVSNFKGG